MSFLVLSPGPEPALRGWAEFSPCGAYRYLLGREWDPALPRFLVAGLNPSKAGADINASPFVATDPNVLRGRLASGLDVDGEPRADEVIAEAAARASYAVIAWGGDAADPLVRPRVARILELLGSLPLFCLGLTKDGFPRHPSRASYSTALEPFWAGGTT